MKDLKQILLSEEVQKGLQSNIFNTDENLQKSLQKVISFADENESNMSIKIETDIDGTPIIFENNLYSNQVYLLESRAFNKESGQQIGSYLQLLDSNGKIYSPDNDVWGDENWKQIKSIQKENDKNE